MNEKFLTKFILSYLIDKDDYLSLNKKQQQLVFETFKTIMTAIYQSIKFDNVFPVIMCGDVEAEAVISGAIASVGDILPSTKKISVHLIH